jgi:uncharacterized cupin superfamily protein
MVEKINLSDIEEASRESPEGKYGLAWKDISKALDTEMPPFEVEWARLSPGKTNFPCHAHQVQWEFYMVVSGQGVVRRDDHTFDVGPGDSFVQPAGAAHQIRNPSESEDLIYYVIADNPVSDPVYYPDSDKWLIHPPRVLGRMTEAEYYDGEG